MITQNSKPLLCVCEFDSIWKCLSVFDIYTNIYMQVAHYLCIGTCIVFLSQGFIMVPMISDVQFLIAMSAIQAVFSDTMSFTSSLSILLNANIYLHCLFMIIIIIKIQWIKVLKLWNHCWRYYAKKRKDHLLQYLLRHEYDQYQQQMMIIVILRILMIVL